MLALFCCVIVGIVVLCFMMELQLGFHTGYGENMYFWSAPHELDRSQTTAPCSECNTGTSMGQWDCLRKIVTFRSVKWRKMFISAVGGAGLYILMKPEHASKPMTFMFITLTVFFMHMGVDNFSSFHGVDAQHRVLGEKMINQLQYKE
jgi:hypothetical protein